MSFGIVGLGPMELVIILVIVLVIFGPRKLPEMGRAIGEMLANFRSGAGKKDEPEDDQAKKGDK